MGNKVVHYRIFAKLILFNQLVLARFLFPRLGSMVLPQLMFVLPKYNYTCDLHGCLLFVSSTFPLLIIFVICLFSATSDSLLVGWMGLGPE